jgi:hypothetical protein
MDIDDRHGEQEPPAQRIKTATHSHSALAEYVIALIDRVEQRLDVQIRELLLRQ